MGYRLSGMRVSTSGYEAMGYGLCAMGYGLWAIWAMGYELWAIRYQVLGIGYRVGVPDMGYRLWAMGYGLWAVGYGLHTTRHTHDRRLAVDECANRSCYTYYETSTRTKIDGQQQCTRHNIAMKSMGHAMHQSWDSDCFEQTVEQTLCQTTPPLQQQSCAPVYLCPAT